jgi:hypothetical protein
MRRVYHYTADEGTSVHFGLPSPGGSHRSESGAGEGGLGDGGERAESSHPPSPSVGGVPASPGRCASFRNGPFSRRACTFPNRHLQSKHTQLLTASMLIGSMMTAM